MNNLDASELNMDGMTANAAGVDGTGAGGAADAGHAGVDNAGVGHADVSLATNTAGSARPTILDVRDLNVTIGGHAVLKRVSLHVDAGERVGLIGASGSGKSMLVKAVTGLVPRTARVDGSLNIGGKRVDTMDDVELADLRGRYVGLVFQNPGAALNPVLTVEQQVCLPLRLHYDLDADERHDRAMTMLERVGLPGRLACAYPHELSGGQQQRVGIATALITSPRLIIADEPTTALDAIVQRSIIDLLVSLVESAGASMLFITHDFAVLSRATTRCVVIDGGRVAETGGTEDLLRNPGEPVTRALVRAAKLLTLGTGVGAGVDMDGTARMDTNRERQHG
ncbi:MAG: ABC transporter ATP-binding protein [Bifidobacterium thermacidophilum]|jgi:peptide/nickel transport system ATP-binding protein|uniref:ABC transporter ATP-binding protein n=1 Tax=Bifidobacterium thermacidophilum TaxID=246618 RepID=UPI002F35A73D